MRPIILNLPSDSALFHAALDKAHVGIVLFDPARRVCFWNQWMTVHAGLTADEVRNKTLEEIFPDDRSKRLEMAIKSAIDQGMVSVLSHSLHHTPLPLYLSGGTRVEQSIVIQPLQTGKGKRHCLLQITDVTASVRRERLLCRESTDLEQSRDASLQKVEQMGRMRRAMLNVMEDLKNARIKAEKANTAKSIFLANMSHELRTPLNAILGFSQLLQDHPATSKSQQKDLDTINSSGKHLLQLINDILDMAKIEAGRIPLELEDFDLGELVRDVIDMIGVHAKEKGLKLFLDQSSNFPRFIHGDAPKIRQILINLLSNAVKFTESGGVTLRLDASNAHPDILLLRGEVEDTGPGIVASDITRIFKPFEQVDDAPSQSGTGLGLSITRQFVGMMGGEITVESGLGGGSLFRFSLQVQHAQDEVCPKPVAGTRRVLGLEPGQPEYRILMAEDQPDNQQLLQRQLEQVGFNVRLAENGEQALKVFQQWHPHFIWMDRRMPVMDGLTATGKIRELPGGKDVKIVALTASVFNGQMNEVVEAGMDDYVRKPYQVEEIFHCMGRYLGVRYLYEETGEVADEKGKIQKEVSLEAIAALPGRLVDELYAAALALDIEQALVVIDQIEESDPGLAISLRTLVEEIDFQYLQRLLKKKT